MARILIVDDESTIRRVVERHLTSAGHSCEQAEDAQSAWTALRRERFDVLFSDINMPGQSGLDLVARVRRARPHIAVIMIVMGPPQLILLLAPLIGTSAMVTAVDRGRGLDGLEMA